MKLKKLTVAEASRQDRTTDDRTTQRRPARTPSPSASGGASVGAIVPSSKAEANLNEKASAIRAAGAERTWTSSPAALGPATKEKARLPFISELPSTNRSWGTIDTKSDASATAKTTLNVPSPKATAASWAKERAPKA